MSYCLSSGIQHVVIVWIGNLNVVQNIFAIEANVVKLYTFVHHHKGYTLIKVNISAILFDIILPLYRLTSGINRQDGFGTSNFILFLLYEVPITLVHKGDKRGHLQIFCVDFPEMAN